MSRTGKHDRTPGSGQEKSEGSFPIKLARCPVCSYLLDGLPIRHQCPECGFEYDKRSDVIKQGRRIALFYVVFAVLSWFILLGVLSEVLSERRGLRFSDFWRAGVPILITVTAIHACLRGDHNIAVVGPDGIQLRSRGESLRRIDWDEWDEIVYTTFGGDAVFRKDGRIVNTVEQMFFGSDRLTRRFIEIANEWKRVMTSDA